jgi:hypothetical protein
MMGVRYIQAWMTILYISETSGKRTAMLDKSRATPNAKQVRRRMGIGIKKTAHVMGLFVINSMVKRGIRTGEN